MTYKISIKPKLSWIRDNKSLHTLPIPIASKLFTQFNSKLRNVIWMNKKLRVVYSIRTSAKCKGGIGLLDIQNYYYATLLDQMRFWFTTPEDNLVGFGKRKLIPIKG